MYYIISSQHLDLDGALAFWESHFTKIMSHDQFVKSYSYNFRHMYGKEGGRKSYTPYSCLKIIMGSPPEIGAHHGCPYKYVLPISLNQTSVLTVTISFVFRHMGDNQLVNTLLALKISPSDTKDIVTLAKSGSPQLACAKHFEITHPGYQSMQLQVSPHLFINFFSIDVFF
jgi:DNA primase large subunit